MHLVLMFTGDHKISIMYRDTEIEGSPFTAKAYDTSAIMVSPLQDGLVGSPVEFTSQYLQVVIGKVLMLHKVVKISNLQTGIQAFIFKSRDFFFFYFLQNYIYFHVIFNINEF